MMIKFLLFLLAFLFLPTLASAQVNLSTEFDVTVIPTVQNSSYSSGNAIGALQTITPFRSVQPTGILNNESIKCSSVKSPR